MIDLHDLRARPAAYQEACRKKGIDIDVRDFISMDERQRTLRAEVESLRASQNAFSKEIPKLSGEEKAHKLEQMKLVAAKYKEQSQLLKEMEEKWKSIQLRLPSIPLDRAPFGKDDTQNVEIKRWGEPPRFNFKARDHIELGKHLDIIDVERGVKVSGARNYFLKGDGVRLVHAMMSLAMDRLHERGYTLMDPPHIVKYEAMMGTSYFPGGEEQAYRLDERDSEMYLIGTAEVPVCSYHGDEILDCSDLPIRLAGYSPCYRREAGTYGKDTAGIYRVHQFYKVEQVILCEAGEEQSAKYHAELLQNAESLMQLLELPYRVVDVCTGDMGQGQVYKNDIEAWMPSRNSYGETHSCSSFGDFQARRLKIRYKSREGQNVFCHTLNNTLAASARMLISLLENHQNPDGSVNVPRSLRDYLKGQTIIQPRKH